jgi:hypothetical protein
MLFIRLITSLRLYASKTLVLESGSKNVATVKQRFEAYEHIKEEKPIKLILKTRTIQNLVSI